MRWAGGSLALLFTALVASVLWPLPVPRVDRSPPPAMLLGRVYASRVVELCLDSPTGVVVGHAHPGAIVEIEPVDGEHVRVAMPLAWSPSSEERIWLYADHGGFTRSYVKPIPPTFPASSRLVRHVSGNALSVDVTTREVFAKTVCGDVHWLESSKFEDRSRVAQVIGNVVLEGWTWDPAIPNVMGCFVTRQVFPRDGRFLLSGGATEADEQMVSSIPAGFVTWGSPAEVERQIVPGLTVHLLTQKPSGKGTCHEWRVEREPGDARALTFARKEPLLYEGRRAYEYFGLQLRRDGPADDRWIDLTGPNYAARPLGPAVGGYRCGIGYRPLGVLDGALRVARGVSLSAIAWSPDDEERWYPTRAACDAARATLDAAVAADRNATPPGGIHRDCFGVWGEKDEDE